MNLLDKMVIIMELGYNNGGGLALEDIFLK